MGIPREDPRYSPRADPCALRYFRDATGRLWDIRLMDAMHVELTAWVQGATCHYEGDIPPPAVVDSWPVMSRKPNPLLPTLIVPSK